MDRNELLACLHEANDALAEFGHHLPAHSPAAHVQVDEARQHLVYAIAPLRLAPPVRRPPPVRWPSEIH